MKITYSKGVNAVYIYLRPEIEDKKTSHGIVDKTTGDWPIHFDWSKDGKLLGIEIMDADREMNIDYIKKVDFVEI